MRLRGFPLRAQSRREVGGQSSAFPMELRVRAADLIGLVLIGEAEFLGTFGDDLEELRGLAAKASERRRAA